MSAVSQRVPIFTMSDIATTGATGFSRTSTVMPLASRVRVTARPSRRRGEGGEAAGARTSGGTERSGARHGFLGTNADPGVVGRATDSARRIPDLLPRDLAQAVDVRQLRLEVQVVSARP